MKKLRSVLVLSLTVKAAGWPALLHCKRDLEAGGRKIHFAVPEKDEAESACLECCNHDLLR